ncbi:MAG: SDR family oxidoreductase [Gloeocapsa sp. DLM2.Bin57]|nr:MAG: SDR family oxidoreductase [Gloeocapsa sp. DLM2.Bin57]
MNYFNLSGEIAIVTGALGRLGPVWIETLLGAGATVLGIDLAKAPLNPQFNQLREQYRENQLYLYRGDVTERSSLELLRDRCLTEIGTPSILVNNAGIDQPPGQVKTYTIEDVPPEIFRQVLEVNVLGAFQVSQVFGAPMVKARKGSIINIGSLYGSVSPDSRFYDHLDCVPPFLKPPAYGASKAALANLTRYLATHWGQYGIRINTLSPGGVLGGQDETFKEKFCARVPLARMAQSEDLTGPLLFLASAASAYVTGIELKVDGGFTAW